jgi:hypothetical protein
MIDCINGVINCIFAFESALDGSCKFENSSLSS